MMWTTLTKICKFWFMAIILICYRTFDIAYPPECSKIDAFMKMYRLGNVEKVRRVHFSAWYLDGSESEPVQMSCEVLPELIRKSKMPFI